MCCNTATFSAMRLSSYQTEFMKHLLNDIVVHLPSGRRAEVVSYLVPPIGHAVKVYEVKFESGGTRLVPSEDLRATGMNRAGQWLGRASEWMQYATVLIIAAPLVFWIVEKVILFFCPPLP